MTLSDKAKADAQEIATEDLNIRDVEILRHLQINQFSKISCKKKTRAGELISGAANAEKSALFLEGIEMTTGAPSNSATVQGQLTTLCLTLREVNHHLGTQVLCVRLQLLRAQRGLPQALWQDKLSYRSAMESALPIAMQDAQTVARFEEQNLSSRQQRAMLATQQRAQFLGMEFDQEFQARVQKRLKISDIANTNFSAEVQIALENSRLAQTTNLTNLGNKQAVVMAQVGYC